jgi:hypothetical protein
MNKFILKMKNLILNKTMCLRGLLIVGIMLLSFGGVFAQATSDTTLVDTLPKPIKKKVLQKSSQATTQSSPNDFSPSVIPPSPDAASLGRYGEFPVSLSKGTPNIAIPIYTLQSGSLSVPISLNYHASGVRVNDVSSSVGLSWSLLAGGAKHKPSFSSTKLGLKRKTKTPPNSKKSRDNIPKNRANWLAKELEDDLVCSFLYVFVVKLDNALL